MANPMSRVLIDLTGGIGAGRVGGAAGGAGRCTATEEAGRAPGAAGLGGGGAVVEAGAAGAPAAVAGGLAAADGGAPGGKVGSLMVGDAVGLGGRLMRTVSFLG